MPAHTAKAMLIRLPGDFPRSPYLSFYWRVQARAQQDGYPDEWQGHFIGSWKAIAYRFRACEWHCRAFTRSVQRFGSAPLESHQYRQDADLFGFFMNGLAALESLYYCLFAMGSRLSPPDFPFATDADFRKVNPTNVAPAFARAYPGDALTIALLRVLATPGFKEWTEVRNVLAHRVAPGRTIYGGNVPAMIPPDELRVGALRIPITDQTTASRRAWLASSLADILAQADGFAAHHC
jgi:hypothetical protein